MSIIHDYDLAFPCEERDSNGQSRQNFGMTFRQYYAGEALKGLLANNHSSLSDGPATIRQTTNLAVKYADDLIARLNIEPPSPSP